MPDSEDNFESAFSDAANAPAADPVVETPSASQAVETPAPVAATPPPPQGGVTEAPPPANPLFDLARQAGFQLGETPTVDEVARLALQQVQSLQPMASYGQQILPHAAEFQKYIESQRPSAEPDAEPEAEWTPEKYFGEQWGAQWDAKYSVAIEQGMVTRDPNTGMWVPTPGYEMAVSGMLPQLNEAQQRQSQNWQEITRGNPYQHFYEKLQEPMRRAWQKDMQDAIQQQFQQVQQESAIDQFEQQNAAWMYAQQNGQRTVTPQGDKFLKEIQAVQKFNKDDPVQVLQLAQRLAGVIPNQPAATPAAVPVVPNAAAASQAQQQSFLQNAVQRAGHQAGQVGSAAQPVNVEETDLNSMFVSAFRSSQGQGA